MNGGTERRDTRNNVGPWGDMPPNPALKMERLILSLPLKRPHWSVLCHPKGPVNIRRGWYR